MYTVYKVKEGETLSSIAKEVSSTTAKICKINGVTSCKEGERLLIEVLEGVPYTVGPFETIQKIASKLKLSEREIAEHNGISDVYIGQVIIIPKRNTEAT